MASKELRYTTWPTYESTDDLPFDLRITLKDSVTHRKCEVAGLLNDEGKETGWHYTFTSGRIASEGLYVDGLLIDKRTFSSGYASLVKVVLYNGKNRTKVSFDLDELGRRKRAVPIGHKHQVHGLYREWDTRTGKLFLSATYKHGVMYGPVTVYYTNGRVKETCNITKNKRNGHLRVYYPSGKLKLSREYIGGKLLGWATMWDEDGKQISTVRTTRDTAWAMHGRHASQQAVTTTIHKFLKYAIGHKAFGKTNVRLTFTERHFNEERAKALIFLADNEEPDTVAHHQV